MPCASARVEHHDLGCAEERIASWRVEPVPELAGFNVEWAEPADWILSRHGTLYHAREPRPPFVALGRVPLPPYLRAGSRLDLARRALRLYYYNVVRRDGEEIFATFDRTIALITPGGARPVTGLERPFRVLRNACGVAVDGSVWFGEYVMSRELTQLRIYCLAPGSDRAEVAHVFPAGFARHIHGVYVDPFDGSVWCLTGDFREHAKILRSSDGIEPFTPIGAGNETWRAVSIQFRADGVYYATDAQSRPNWIYHVDRRSGTRTAVAPLDGPVYYSHRVGDDLFFAVSAEMRPGRQGQRATLWHLDRELDCAVVASFAKDRWPVSQFLPGTLAFPRGPGEGGAFYFSGIALSRARGTTFRCSPVTPEPSRALA
jgi:hypothetical protein